MTQEIDDLAEEIKDTLETGINYPDIAVRLFGNDGNAAAIIGSIRRELHRHGVSPDRIKDFTDETRSGDYGHVLQTCQKWVTVL